MPCKPDVNHFSKVVPEGGFEPPTRGFSIQRLANENNGECVNRGENGSTGINALENACKPNSDVIKLGEGWTAYIRAVCAKRCADKFGDPPCWSLAGDTRMGETPEFIEPCRPCKVKARP